MSTGLTLNKWAERGTAEGISESKDDHKNITRSSSSPSSFSSTDISEQKVPRYEADTSDHNTPRNESSNIEQNAPIDESNSEQNAPLGNITINVYRNEETDQDCTCSWGFKEFVIILIILVSGILLIYITGFSGITLILIFVFSIIVIFAILVWAIFNA